MGSNSILEGDMSTIACGSAIIVMVAIRSIDARERDEITMEQCSGFSTFQQQQQQSALQWDSTQSKSHTRNARREMSSRNRCNEVTVPF